MGKSGGRPKKETNGFPEEETNGFEKNKTSGFPEEETKTKPNVNDNVNDNVKETIFCNSDAEKIQQVMLETIGTTNINNINECINYLDKLPLELIEYALRKTARINRPCWQYAITILESYIDKNFKTVEEAKADDSKYKSKSNNKVQDETEEETIARKTRELEEVLKSANK